jgi:hypothetical protein
LSHVSSPFCSGYFGDRVLLFCTGQPGLRCSYFTLLTTAGMTGMHNQTQLFSIEMGSHKCFCPGWPGTTILPISASQVARISRRDSPSPGFRMTLKKNPNIRVPIVLLRYNWQIKM